MATSKKSITKPRTAANKLDAVGIGAICKRLIAGETQRAIAADIGVGAASLVEWIAADSERSARARSARIYAAESYSDMAEEELRNAEGQFELAKARELASHFRWKASKANPRDYGDKVQQEVSGPDGGPVQIDATLSPSEAYKRMIGK